MRDAFALRLLALAADDPRIMLITGDLGFGVLDNFRERFPRQFLNAGVAEQNMTGIATGLALGGRTVFTYSIGNFPTLRCLEQIRNDAAYHDANVKVVAIGGGFSYGPLGMSHHATEDLSILRALPITVVAPGDDWEAAEATDALARAAGTCYLRLDKTSAGDTRRRGEQFVLGKARVLREGNDLTVITTGGMLRVVLEAIDLLAEKSVACRVLSMHTIKPIDRDAIIDAATSTGGILTVEEHSVDGGLGGAVAEVCMDAGAYPKAFERLGVRGGFVDVVGTQDYLRAVNGLDASSIATAALTTARRGGIARFGFPFRAFATMTSQLTMVVAGARPNFMKVAPVLRALERRGRRFSFVHTGQHYDSAMSGNFLVDLDMPAPDHHLGVGSGSHAQQTARVMEAFEPVLTASAPSWLIVVGDVNSTLACALVASKLGRELGTRIAHVEAGLRSGDWSMPEEVNRVLTDRLADLLLTPSEDAAKNLLREGIDAERIQFVGNVMVDTLVAHVSRARALDRPRSVGVETNCFALVTLHRPSNVDDLTSFTSIVAGLERVAELMPVVIPLHPRTRQRAESFGLMDRLSRFRLLPPQGYLEMLSLTSAASVVLTDSGGLQEETTVLGVPCVTLREGTERPVTIVEGTNQLCDWPITADGIESSFRNAIARRRPGDSLIGPRGWDGHAADRIVDALEKADAAIALSANFDRTLPKAT